MVYKTYVVQDHCQNIIKMQFTADISIKGGVIQGDLMDIMLVQHYKICKVFCCSNIAAII